jgi:hypothetical protein
MKDCKAGGLFGVVMDMKRDECEVADIIVHEHPGGWRNPRQLDDEFSCSMVIQRIKLLEQAFKVTRRGK